jgi:hypothetical protein
MPVAQDHGYFQVWDETLPINWTTDGDRLIHLVLEGLAVEMGGAQGWGISTHHPTADDPYRYVELEFRDPRLLSKLCFVELQSGARIAAVRVPDRTSTTPAQVHPWLASLARALENLEEEMPTHPWSAAIGMVGERASGRLHGGVRLGGFTLSPADRPYVEVVEQKQIPNLGGGQIRRDWLAIVQGASVGYSPAAARELAAEELNLLCALLSVATGIPWRIRHAPEARLLTAGTLPKTRMSGDIPFRLPDDESRDEEVVLPNWLEPGLALVRKDDALRRSVLAQWQAMLLEDEFPSHALVAYVSVIESMGSRLVELKKCSCCGQCSVRVGANKRFREAIKLVREPTDAKQLGAAYNARSLTAHEGRLHGGEERHGSFPTMRFFSGERMQMFRLTEVWPLRDASRDLLLLALEGRFPEDSLSS